ncbi:hydroxyproline O-galactosyltransferase GALT2-like isoform X1 [Apium graveolens]|uniref:hydroxyproline O-galactosyltransferase GALT2-like isoform X1 n=1 Tax=Apium graveolens TaxID=4045 RepID=UPI003D7B6186
MKNSRKDRNAVLKPEAAYFGDIVILPFLDHYELAVFKNIAICEYGVQNASAAQIRKSDDTFIRVDTILKELDKVAHVKALEKTKLGNVEIYNIGTRFSF